MAWSWLNRRRNSRTGIPVATQIEDAIERAVGHRQDRSLVRPALERVVPRDEVDQEASRPDPPRHRPTRRPDRRASPGRPPSAPAAPRRARRSDRRSGLPSRRSPSRPAAGRSRPRAGRAARRATIAAVSRARMSGLASSRSNGDARQPPTERLGLPATGVRQPDVDPLTEMLLRIRPIASARGGSGRA